MGWSFVGISGGSELGIKVNTGVLGKKNIMEVIK